ncbi:hypothetical protein [Treponema denticola]|uniref:hypothetical protein n=1 Tax=Treponema denticola TaxID=158 RepID=UPI0012BAF19F|nr:hypothetical protein [Treponema denticola]
MLIACYGDADGRTAPASAARIVGAAGKHKCCAERQCDKCGCDERRGSFFVTVFHK